MTQVTIDLGKVKFNWRGTYDPSASYSSDDVVHYGGSAWVAVSSVTGLAPGATADWEMMALGGDPLSTMITPGDLLVRGATGLERLPLGPPNSLVKVNSAGTAVEYGSDSNAKLIQRQRNVYTSGAWENTTAMNWVPGLYYDVTPVDDTSAIVIKTGFTVRKIGANDHITNMNVAMSNPDGSDIQYISRFETSNHSGTYHNQWTHYEFEVPSWGAGITKRIGLLSAAYDYANYRGRFHETYWSQYDATTFGLNAYPYWIAEEWKF